MKIKLKNAEIQEYVNAPASAAESIEVKIIFYEKKSDGIVFEIPEE